jgi:hypothetical protein
MPATAITVAPDETLTGGLCLVAMDPDSNSLLLAQPAPGRAQDTWNTLLEQALAGLHGQVMPSTSDEAPGLLADVEHPLGAHHSPDLCHVPQALRKAVGTPLAAKERAAHKVLETAQEILEQVTAREGHPNRAPEKRGPGRPPQVAASLAQAAQAVDAAHQEHQRLFEQRERSTQSLRAIGNAYPCVDVERGVRRHGPRIARESQAQVDPSRTIADQAGLSPSALARSETADRVIPKRQATIAFVSGDVPYIPHPFLEF